MGGLKEGAEEAEQRKRVEGRCSGETNRSHKVLVFLREEGGTATLLRMRKYGAGVIAVAAAGGTAAAVAGTGRR